MFYMQIAAKFLVLGCKQNATWARAHANGSLFGLDFSIEVCPGGWMIPEAHSLRHLLIEVHAPRRQRT